MRLRVIFLVALMVGWLPGLVCGESQVEHSNVAFAIAPDGGRLVFSAADGRLCLLNLRTRQVTALALADAT